ncbi:MAG TPA: D-xylose ABC transporter ATP-binding protein, partial [Clostridiaceae bacterium]|nr:D-xylose ABC transporter ATP-binding protein [Clostridiaceae bacterium]
GENGAGKSTLIKILTGAHKNDSGKIFIEGKEVSIDNPKDALNYGISAIYQELNTIPQLSIAENVFLGRPLKKHGNRGLLDIAQMRKKSKELLNELGQEVDPTVKLSSLGIGKQQMVEIAKALSIKTRLLIMDEPTSSLTEKEVKDLFATIRGLKNKGITIIFISHRLEEVMKICDRVTVMRDGKKIDTLPIDKVDKNQLIKMMVGHSLDQQYPKVRTELGDEVLRVENLNKNGVFKNISFYVRRGEIVGFSGLVGSGRTEVMRAVFGADSYDSGEIYINGKKSKISCPRDAMNQGMAFLTEDRKGQGLILDNTIAFNTNIASLSKSSSGVFLDNKKLKGVAKNNINELSIKTPSENFIVRQLSGGNQQKVVIAKWLNTKANIYIFDEPT